LNRGLLIETTGTSKLKIGHQLGRPMFVPKSIVAVPFSTRSAPSKRPFRANDATRRIGYLFFPDAFTSTCGIDIEFRLTGPKLLSELIVNVNLLTMALSSVKGRLKVTVKLLLRG